MHKIAIKKNTEHRGIIGVCGASILTENNYTLVIELGKEIARQNFIVACGGLGGTMEAVCKGAKEMNGLTIGIIPGTIKSQANKYVDIIIPTGMGEARNAILVNASDGIIAVSGGAGTLSEIALAWRENKPIVSLSNTGGWAEALSNQKIDKTREDIIYPASSPLEAVEKLISLLEGN